MQWLSSNWWKRIFDIVHEQRGLARKNLEKFFTANNRSVLCTGVAIPRWWFPQFRTVSTFPVSSQPYSVHVTVTASTYTYSRTYVHVKRWYGEGTENNTREQMFTEHLATAYCYMWYTKQIPTMLWKIHGKLTRESLLKRVHALYTERKNIFLFWKYRYCEHVN